MTRAGEATGSEGAGRRRWSVARLLGPYMGGWGTGRLAPWLMAATVLVAATPTAGAQTATPAPLPPAVLAPGAALDAEEFAASWPLRADGAAPGDIARLAVPDVVYGVAKRGLADLRLETGGRRLPHVLRALDEPVAAVAEAGLRPRVASEGGSSYLLLPLATARLPITGIELTAPAAPFARRVTAGYLLDAEGPDLPRYYQSATIDDQTWRCPGAALQPCRLRLAGRPARSRWLLLTFDDGENAPLPSVDVTVWRQGHALRFPWPGEAVRLLAGNPTLGHPQYDLANVADQLYEYPAREARLIEATPAPPAVAALGRLDDQATRLALVLALVLAGAVLLAVLARVLRAPEEPV